MAGLSGYWALYYDGTGLCLFAKRLESGRFCLAADRGWQDGSDAGNRSHCWPMRNGLAADSCGGRANKDPWRLAEKNAGLSNILCVRPGTPARDSVSRVHVVSDPAAAGRPSFRAARDLAVDLQAELARKDIEIAANAAVEIHAKTLHIEKLKMQLAVLRRARFGCSSEKLDHAIEQLLELLIGELEADAGAVEARDTAGDAARRATRQAAGNANIRSASRCRHTCRARPSPPTKQPALKARAAAARCSAASARTSARCWNHVPSSFKVIRHIRLEAELSRLRDDRAADAQSADRTRPAWPRPARAGSGGEVLRPYTAAPPGRHYAREGVELDHRSTLADWVGRSVFPLDPLAEAIGRHVRAGQCCMPTTPPSRTGARTGKTRTGRLWVVVRDERPFTGYSAGRLLSLPPTARASTPRCCEAAAAASFMPMAMPASTVSIGPPRRTARQAADRGGAGVLRRKFYDIHHASASIAEAMERIAALFVIEISSPRTDA